MYHPYRADIGSISVSADSQGGIISEAKNIALGHPSFLLVGLCFWCSRASPVCSLQHCGCVAPSGRLEKCDPELISTVMEYCLQMRCRSEPIFEAVAEDFVRRGETHTTLQIAKQIIAMGRLNYLPEVSRATLPLN